MKSRSVFILILICSVSICCVSKKKENNNAKTEIKNIEDVYIDDSDTPAPVESIITEYVTLPNGITVDSRVSQEVVDMILKRFEAIENGDIVAFRSTLGQMEDGVDYYYQLGLINEFFWDFFDISPDDFHDAVADGSEKLSEIAHTLFYGEHPLKSRNTGLIVKRIEYSSNGGLKVKATNNKNEELNYNFSYY